MPLRITHMLTRCSRFGRRSVWSLCTLLLAVPLPLLAQGTTPAPRVAALYSSFQDGGARFRTSHDDLFARLGGPCACVENMDVQQVLPDLHRADTLCPTNVCNGEDPQPPERCRERGVR